MAIFYFAASVLSAVLAWRAIKHQKIDGVIGGYSKSDGQTMFWIAVGLFIAFALYFLARALAELI